MPNKLINSLQIVDPDTGLFKTVDWEYVIENNDALDFSLSCWLDRTEVAGRYRVTLEEINEHCQRTSIGESDVVDHPGFDC